MQVNVNPFGKFEGSPGFITSLTLSDQEGNEVVLVPDESGNIEVDAVVATELIKTPRFTFARP